MPSELSRTEVRSEVKEEGNLLIEAVSLLVQRQRETESWVAEQIWQAEERAAAAERHYGELESRLAGIEQHLARLVHEVDPSSGDRLVAEQLNRLREQVDDLKAAGGAGLPLREGAPGGPRAQAETVSVSPRAADAADVAPSAGVASPRYVTDSSPRPVGGAAPRYAPETASPRGAAGVAARSGAGFWDLLGNSPQDRAGVLLIGAGAVAVLYALLTQLRY